jgi:hypothetical protein
MSRKVIDVPEKLARKDHTGGLLSSTGREMLYKRRRDQALTCDGNANEEQNRQSL